MADGLQYDDTRNVPGDEKLAEVHAKALKHADEAWIFESDNIMEGREDQRFYAGGSGQWPQDAIKARGTQRPMLTINRLPTFVRQLTGDVRQNTPAIKVLPAKGEASQETADILNGLIRNIEALSDADACYVIAAENAAISGQGAIRIVREYGDDKTFEQELRIRPIRDPFGVMIDPMAQLPDKSDMTYAFIFERLSIEAFKAAYPDKSVDDMPRGGADGASTTGFTWRTGDSVRIAEYWRKVPEKTKIYQLVENGPIVDKLPAGAKAVREREVESGKVESYMISGSQVLSGPHEWGGKNIPIGFVVGEEITIDGATKRKGMVRDAKDPQRLLNYACTTDAETTALQPKAPWLLTLDMIAGFEGDWDRAGSENFPYLLYKPDMKAPQGPKREQPPLLSPALTNMSMTAGQYLKDVTGIQDASLGKTSNETSGRAILARQKEGDTGTFLYPDNLRRALSYLGRCLVEMIPITYDSERIVRVLNEDGTHDMATINQTVRDPETGIDTVLNDLSLGAYDVVVSTGPSYLTRQQEMADDLIQLSTNMPIVAQVAPDLVVKALNIPGGDEIAKRIEKTLPPGLVDAKEGEQPPSLPGPPPNPADVAKAEKDAAAAAKLRAETEGLEIANIGSGLQLMTMLQNLNTTMAAMQQQLAGLAAGPQPPQEQSGAGAPQPMGEAAPPVPQPIPPQTNGAAPMGDGMGELVDMHPPA